MVVGQESEGPFPYKRPMTTLPSSAQNYLLKTSTAMDQVKRLPQSLQTLPGLQNMFHARDCIGFKLPPLHSNAGVVFRHAVRNVETILKREYPCIFKLGYTHNALFRWENQLYGYEVPRDKWSHMCVLYVSDEVYSCAMLEAGLIEKFQRNSSYFSLLFMFHAFCLFVCFLNATDNPCFFWSWCQRCPGRAAQLRHSRMQKYPRWRGYCRYATFWLECEHGVHSVQVIQSETTLVRIETQHVWYFNSRHLKMFPKHFCCFLLNPTMHGSTWPLQKLSGEVELRLYFV